MLHLAALLAYIACPPSWGYGPQDGPDRWGQMEASWETCDSGTRQSPVDLGTSVRSVDVPELRLAYADGPLVVQNTGRNLEVPTARGTLRFGELEAELRQLHFHVKSEHAVGNAHAEAELHLVHESATGRKVVVAVLIDRRDAANPALQRILDLRPPTTCMSGRAMTNFNPQMLLPANTARLWTYSGSLTTPSCAEGVTFIILVDRIGATREQLDAIRVAGDNNRPLQPLGTRTVIRNF